MVRTDGQHQVTRAFVKQHLKNRTKFVSRGKSGCRTGFCFGQLVASIRLSV